MVTPCCFTDVLSLFVLLFLFLRIRSMLDQLADTYPLTRNPTIIARDTFAIVIYSGVNPASFAGQTVTALMGNTFQFRGFTIENIGQQALNEATGSITLPRTLFNGRNLVRPVKLVFNMYLTESLFVRRQQYLMQTNRTYNRLGSIVMAARISGGVRISGLEQPVQQSYYKNPVSSILEQPCDGHVMVM